MDRPQETKGIRTGLQSNQNQTKTTPAMTEQEFISKKAELEDKLNEVKKPINEEYNRILKEFQKEHCSLEVGKVYELVGTGKKPRGHKRFVVYSIETNHYKRFSCVVIRVGGWWLNAKNTPDKWQCYTVYGVGNKSVFILSDDQTNEPHPESDKQESAN